MTAFLLTWNDKQWPHYDLDKDVARIQRGEPVSERWSTGNTKTIRAGDRVFFLRQGTDRGLIGSGFATSDCYYDDHWSDSRPHEKALYVQFDFDALVGIGERLTTETLQRSGLRLDWNRIYASGIKVPASAEERLEALWRDHLSLLGQEPLQVATAGEVPTPSGLHEGSRRRVWVNAYERNPIARRACIAHYGCMCSVCSFDFGRTFGDLGDGFIHVHHLIELSAICQDYEVDPIEDLRPVCPNCHAMLHMTMPAMSIAELQQMMRRRTAGP